MHRAVVNARHHPTVLYLGVLVMPYPTATPESQGMDSSRLANLTAWQEQMVADGKVRSSALSVCVCLSAVRRRSLGLSLTCLSLSVVVSAAMLRGCRGAWRQSRVPSGHRRG